MLGFELAKLGVELAPTSASMSGEELVSLSACSLASKSGEELAAKSGNGLVSLLELTSDFVLAMKWGTKLGMM